NAQLSTLDVDVLPAAGESAITTFAIQVDDDGDGSVFNTTKYVQANGSISAGAIYQTDSVWATRQVTGLSVDKIYRFRVLSRNGNSVDSSPGTSTPKYTLSQVPQTPLTGTIATTSIQIDVVPEVGEPSNTAYSIEIDTDTDGTAFNTVGYVQSDGS